MLQPPIPQLPSEIELKTFFECHIPSACAAYNYVSSIEYEWCLVQQLHNLSLQDVLKILNEAAAFQIDAALPHCIFVILPTQDRSQHTIQFASQHWVDIVVSLVKRDKVVTAAQELFEIYMCNPFTKGAAGQLLCYQYLDLMLGTFPYIINLHTFFLSWLKALLALTLFFPLSSRGFFGVKLHCRIVP